MISEQEIQTLNPIVIGPGDFRKPIAKDGKDGKEGKDDISAVPHGGIWE